MAAHPPTLDTAVTVVVPLTPGNLARDRNWEWIATRYARVHPTWQVVTCPDPGPGEWSKGRAVDIAVRYAAGETLVIADADVIAPVELLNEAVRLVCTGEVAWVMPHRTVTRLTEHETLRLLAQPPEQEPVWRHGWKRHVAPIGGGIVVCTRTAHDQVGGIDPRFTVWGGEDLSFGWALDTLIGPHECLNGPLWHLHHERMPRRSGNRASPTNEALAGAYRDANGDPAAMTALIER